MRSRSRVSEWQRWRVPRLAALHAGSQWPCPPATDGPVQPSYPARMEPTGASQRCQAGRSGQRAAGWAEEPGMR